MIKYKKPVTKFEMAWWLKNNPEWLLWSKLPKLYIPIGKCFLVVIDFSRVGPQSDRHNAGVVALLCIVLASSGRVVKHRHAVSSSRQTACDAGCCIVVAANLF